MRAYDFFSRARRDRLNLEFLWILFFFLFLFFYFILFSSESAPFS